MDLFGPLQTRSASGNKLILVITDAFTKYTELVPLLNKEAATVARAFFERWICRFGVPTVIISDRGKEFLNEVMKDLTQWLGIDHDKTSPYHPQTNASAERYNRTMKAYLTAMLGNDQTLDWEEWLPALIFSYNTQVHKSTLESPFFLTYLHNPRLPFFDIKQPRPLYKEGFVPKTTARLGTAYKQAHEHMEEARLLRERYYNRRAETRQFSVGDSCLCLLYTSPSPRDLSTSRMPSSA